ncbi:hypothetical protein, partial [Streptomyces sp. NPDC097981]|uniref:hypothetical protein n=1 Tax=Streptomyces sp. NPDC097981 TaxID=3155428 RepID=UPI003331666E
DDLADTIVDVDEFAALIDTSEIMLRYCGADVISNNYERLDSPTAMKGPRYRWRVGHHLFSFSTIFCRHFLMAAAGPFRASPERVAALIEDARISLRGTTAAMRYAANMSQGAYLDVIRPSMEAAWPGGFSGTQHLDYERLKRAREDTRQALLSEYGQLPADWPQEVRLAFGGFCETEVEDLEQHTLIAASKVGTTSSLLTAAAGGASDWAAVKQLRSMANKRQRELRGFLT